MSSFASGSRRSEGSMPSPPGRLLETPHRFATDKNADVCHESEKRRKLPFLFFSLKEFDTPERY
jgi:hypothetical protein